MFKNLRLLAMLRRIARALESLSESQKELASAAHERRLRREDRITRKPRKTEFGTLDITEAEKRFRARLEEETFEEPDHAA